MPSKTAQPTAKQSVLILNMTNGSPKIVLTIVTNVSTFGVEKFVCMPKSTLYNAETDLNTISSLLRH